ncbi:Alpha/Beta hydrolase protein [Cokeromyces recurvatus]|uniref:Alpha/Beta hydrolase protein n=1 Tax=Cokeromyces recurvatus TaxID=90255 RepID=UPI00221FAE33|nr:Alpha/Beta hydrolase protein [Cokeromyces recurvatus]KAI7899375.1 Alpha/Beta hydrolase protein [Cokeromyces recurvatus]
MYIKSFLLVLFFMINRNTCFTPIKRSKLHESFPEYSLRYTYPTLCNTTSKQTSGYFELPDGKNFFFWFFESSKDYPLVLWLNGGPGCSSMLGLLMGIGPCYVNNQGNELVSNPYAWTNKANIIYLDQPIDSGYSYHNNHSFHVVDTQTASIDVYVFLQLFFREFSEFAKSDFHIAGESYAGHYLPAIATTINEENLKENHYHPSIQLKSLMIGNGLTDPLIQYQYYKPMVCTPSSYGPPLISSSKKCQELESQQIVCQNWIKKCYKQHQQHEVTTEMCKIASNICNSFLVKPIIDSTTLNMYDIRRQCEAGPLCYNYSSAIEKYLNRLETKSMLGVNATRKFEICSNTVNANFYSTGDWMRPYSVQQIITLLDQGVKVLAYAGDADLLCNWMGIDAWTFELEWYGKENFQAQQEIFWKINDNETVGTLRKYNELTFLRLFNAGHMAYYDQPKIALEMFSQWISDSL